MTNFAYVCKDFSMETSTSIHTATDENYLILSLCTIISISLLKSIFVNAKVLILSYKIYIFAFTKTVLEQKYLEIIAP